jgi:hypothetical protein
VSGFVERVIEDWLTNCDERSYQASFVSSLIRSGHRIRYVSKHSTLEFGKDIVSSSPDGHLTAYQLKAGNMNLSLWRQVRGEVFELAEVPFRTSAGRKLRTQRCYLVTTGLIDDTVKEQLRDYNEANVEKGLVVIETIERHELIRLFVDTFTEFVPANLASFNDLVRVYLSDGRGPVDKPLLSSVFRDLASHLGKKKAVLRAVSNLVVAAEFASTPFRLADNYISVMDVWTLAACRVAWLARRGTATTKQAPTWLALCYDAIDWSGSRLVAEVNERSKYVDENDPLVDIFAVPYRKTVALGYASAVLNSRRMVGIDTDGDSRRLLESTIRQLPLGIWSEGSWNYYWNLALAISASPEGNLAALGLVLSWLDTLCSSNGLEPPYRTVESELSGKTSASSVQRERVTAFYSLAAAIDFVCRRMWRRALSSRWIKISKRDLVEVIPDRLEDHFEWVIDEATVEVERLPMRASWRQLRKGAFEQRSGLFSDDDAWLLPYMLCSYPHRVSRKLSGELDYRTSGVTARREWDR